MRKIAVKIDLNKKHKISPYLYMQFMEPLSACDASVDAAWDYAEGRWYPEALELTKELAPTMMRFGGCFASYYHWKEAVGEQRIPMVNYMWDGLYSNHVGTHEFLDFCRDVQAEPLLVVNMESDGRQPWAHPKEGIDRCGTAEEAAEWVAYCNDAEHGERAKNGRTKPFRVKYWQIGNETSYDKQGYDLETCARVTEKFAKAMRKADPDLCLIGWGDDFPDRCTGEWCRRMDAVDGIDLLAFHHHFDSGLPDAPWKTGYHADPDKTWLHLMNAYKSLHEHITQMRQVAKSKRLAMTEGHFALPGIYRNTVLSTWAAGVAYARCLNVIARHSDVLDIATMADFMGNMWQVNAIMLDTPLSRKHGTSYLQPVGRVMSLFGKHRGEYALDVTADNCLDLTASATGDTVYLHIANTDMHSSAELVLDGIAAKSVKMYGVAADPMKEISYLDPHCFDPAESDVMGNPVLAPAAVCVLEIKL